MLNRIISLWYKTTDLLFMEMELLADVWDVLFRLLLLNIALMIFMIAILGICVIVLRCMVQHLTRSNTVRGRFSVGIFHPYSEAGGGGERVLWCAVKALQDRYHFIDCVIYTLDDTISHDDLSRDIKKRFNISLPRPVQLVSLTTRPLLEPRLYPRATLLLQALGSVVVALEAVLKYRPDVFLDTMGYSFVYPLVRLLTSSKIACYIHYPVISTDMLDVVVDGAQAHNNAGFIARSALLTQIKLCYYTLFARVYGLVGSTASVIMVNSSWTRSHINTIWNTTAGRTKLVFPPCDITKFSSLEILPYEDKLMKKIVSIGQFRPEKDHALQLRSFKRLLELVSERGGDIEAVEVQLVLVGGCRNEEDHSRVSRLQDLAKQLNIDKQVEFYVNISFDELTDLVQESCVGLHTMWNEHFGISVVEMQAAGLITVAHDSGGPKQDIVVPHQDNLTGLLASDEESYAESMHIALTMCDEDRHNMQRAARLSAARFTDEKFEELFLQAMEEVLPSMDH